jgi:hypothetical protein
MLHALITDDMGEALSEPGVAVIPGFPLQIRQLLALAIGLLVAFLATVVAEFCIIPIR